MALQGCDQRPKRRISGLVHGCAALRDGVCHVRDIIDVWLPGADAFTWRGARVDEQTPVQQGIRYTLRVESGATRVEARRATADAHQEFTQRTTEHRPDPALIKARAAIKARRFDDAQAHLDRLKSQATLAAPVASLQARLFQRRGDKSAAAQAFRSATTLNRAQGHVIAAADAAIVAAFLYLERLGRPTDARHMLDQVDSAAYPAAEVRKQSFLGRSALWSGDIRAALQHLRLAFDLGRKIGLGKQTIFIRSQMAQALGRLGRTSEALGMLAELLDDPELKSCLRALLLNNAGWFRYVGAERQGRVDPKSVSTLQSALDLYARDCRESDGAIVTRVNLLLACLAAHEMPCARTQRQALRRETIAPGLTPWLHDIDGRLALARDRPAEALTQYTKLAAQDIAALTPGLLWRAHVGRAEALIALGRLADARAALQAAEAQLDHELSGVPLHEGRESFVADRGRSAQILVDVLLRLGAPRAAFDAARRARARVLRALTNAARMADAEPAVRARREVALAAYRQTRTVLMDEMALDAERSTAELAIARRGRIAKLAAAQNQLDSAFADSGERWVPAARPTDRLSVLYHPTRDGWVGFAARGTQVTARRLPKWQASTPTEQLGAALLQPFAAELRDAHKVEFMPFGATRDLDLHALPLDGRPLAETAAVSYALDVPTGPPPAARSIAVVIADPRGDLPAARTEADAVVPILSRQFTVQQLRGLAATPTALRDAAERADVLHYAGHGVFKGANGWQSVLPLADGQSVGVGDILALRSAPRLVVLSGCETARSARGAAEGLGLGQAFVASGAREVVAATRPVPDAAAGQLIAALHTARATGLSTANALQAAQRILRAQSPSADWAAFRLLTP